VKGRILEGIKIADFSWVAVGPRTISYLAQYGADVVRVESSKRPEALRVTPPFKEKVTHINKSAYFADFNPNKYGMSLDMNHPEAREVAKRLVMWADVVAESFTPGTMAKWGLAYDDLVKIKPDIIMFSTCQQGQTGPHASLPALGTQLVSLAGFTFLTGWPDREPVGPYGPYTDTPAPYFAAIAILAALKHRRKTGKGMHIDLAQYETGVLFLAPLVLDYFVNGTVAERMGNRCPYAAPHGAFPCKGEDRWCFIAVYTDDEWKALCKVMGEPEWTKSDKFTTLLSRKRNEDELEQLIADWTANFDAHELMQQLQYAGVPAGVAQTGEDLHNDPQLKHRQYLHQLEHPEIGWHSYDGLPFKLSKSPSEFRMPAPLLGQHTEYVCTKFLGMSDEEFVKLMAEGVFE